MNLKSLAGLIIAASVLTACQSKVRDGGMGAGNEPVPSAADLRVSMSQNPDVAATGMVVQVLPEQSEAAIGDLQGAPVQKDDIVTFIGTDNAVSTGTVIGATDAGTARVKYTAQGVRPPAKGDLVIKLKAKSAATAPTM